LKKQCLLLASAMGFAGAASAQSSVTIFGVMDATIAVGRGSLDDRTQLTRGGLATPRLGFRGVEDLGGGLRAGFWLEAQANTDDGSSAATNTNNQASGTGAGQGLTFSRRSTVSLLGNWGEVRAGRDVVPQYHNLSRGDVFGNVGVGSAILYTAIITGEVRVRASNTISYLSPKFGGFSAQVSHYLGENPSGTATEDDGTGTGVHLAYENGPLQFGAGYGRTEYAAGDVVQSNLFAGYDFRVARVVATISRDKAGTLSARGAEIGVGVPVGVGEAKAEYSFYKISNGREARKLAVGYVHNLSKRTALYVTAARVNNSGGASFALNGARTAANASSTGYDLGIRHSF
jgi:predicted porin